MYLPGANIPIINNKKLTTKKPNYLFNFAWNFIDEIYKENFKFIKKGGVIINLIPKIKFYK